MVKKLTGKDVSIIDEIPDPSFDVSKLIQFDNECIDALASEIIAESLENAITTSIKRLKAIEQISPKIAAAGTRILPSLKGVLIAIEEAPKCTGGSVIPLEPTGGVPSLAEAISRRLEAEEKKQKEKAKTVKKSTGKEKGTTTTSKESTKGKTVPSKVYAATTPLEMIPISTVERIRTETEAPITILQTAPQVAKQLTAEEILATIPGEAIRASAKTAYEKATQERGEAAGMAALMQFKQVMDTMIATATTTQKPVVQQIRSTKAPGTSRTKAKSSTVKTIKGGTVEAAITVAPDAVQINKAITLKFAGEKVPATYTMVPTEIFKDQAMLVDTQHKLRPESDLGKLIYGKKAGEVVTMKVAGQPVKVTIQEVSEGHVHRMVDNPLATSGTAESQEAPER